MTARPDPRAEIPADADAARALDAFPCICKDVEGVSCWNCRVARPRVVRLLAAVRGEQREADARIAEKAYRDEPDGIDDGWDNEGAKRRRTKRIAAAIRRTA